MNKTITITLLIVVALLGVMFLGQRNAAQTPTPAQANAKSSLTASEILYDFGTISMANGNVSHCFSVTNPTAQDITVEDLTTSCMCTSAYIVNGTGKQGPFGMPGMGYVPKANMLIKAGETRQIDVVYDPNAHGPAGVGTIDRFVYLASKNAGTLQLEIKAVVTP
jgi:hypothetical protein